MSVATGFAQGHESSAELVRRAVRQALDEVNTDVASSVLLFLTSPFHDPSLALKTAARAANCTQITGCVAPGIFTEKESAITLPAAAAMVFTEGLALQATPSASSQARTLVLAAAGEVSTDWSDAGGTRFGALTAAGMPLWRNGRIEAAGYCEVQVQGAHGTVAAAPGMRMLNVFRPVTAVQGHDLVFLGGKPALQTLQQAWPEGAGELVLNRLMACVADSEEAAAHGQFQTLALMGASADHRSVTLSHPVESGLWLCWALRDVGLAEHEYKLMLEHQAKTLSESPDFGILFSCLSRSPLLDIGTERDLQLLRRRFPSMPLIGFYGMGEIAPMHGVSHPLQHAAVLGLFSELS